MPHNGTAILEHWHNLAKLIVEEQDEQKQAELLGLFRQSYQEEIERQKLD